MDLGFARVGRWRCFDRAVCADDRSMPSDGQELTLARPRADGPKEQDGGQRAGPGRGLRPVRCQFSFPIFYFIYEMGRGPKVTGPGLARAVSDRVFSLLF